MLLPLEFVRMHSALFTSISRSVILAYHVRPLESVGQVTPDIMTGCHVGCFEGMWAVSIAWHPAYPPMWGADTFVAYCGIILSLTTGADGSLTHRLLLTFGAAFSTDRAPEPSFQ